MALAADAAIDTETEIAKFLDFFIDIKPAKRTERGWEASWRNWVRSARRHPTNGSHKPRRHFNEDIIQGFADWAAGGAQ